MAGAETSKVSDLLWPFSRLCPLAGLEEEGAEEGRTSSAVRCSKQSTDSSIVELCRRLRNGTPMTGKRQQIRKC